ncbi:MAG: tyrosine-type recombinase/integrase [Hyphomonadaceae bacterium]|jgi:integrase
MAAREPGKKLRLNKRNLDTLLPDPENDYVVTDTEVKGLRVRVRTSGRKTFEFRYRAARGQRLYVIGDLGAMTADEATREATRLAGIVASGGDPQGDKSNKRLADAARVSVAEAASLYLTLGAQDKPDKRASSWERDRVGLERHLTPILGSKKLADLTSADLAKWQADVASGRTAKTLKTKKRGLARISGGVGTAARAMLTVSAWLEWCLAHGLVAENVAKRVARYKTGGKERYLSESEAAAVWDAVNSLQAEKEIGADAANIFRLLALTGARRGEIVGLRWPEVDLRRGLLLLPPLRHKTGGGAKPKAVPLPSEAISILSAIPRKGEYVFPKSDGLSAIEPPKRAWAKIWKRAGVEGASPHTLRHTLASWAVADGQSLAVVGKVLGHSRPQTTARYAHFAAGAGVEALEAVAGRYLSYSARTAKAVSEDAA